MQGSLDLGSIWDTEGRVYHGSSVSFIQGGRRSACYDCEARLKLMILCFTDLLKVNLNCRPTHSGMTRTRTTHVCLSVIFANQQLLMRLMLHRSTQHNYKIACMRELCTCTCMSVVCLVHLHVLNSP